jgi:hypothetical protein
MVLFNVRMELADYPRLSQMAIDILSIPSMSADAERVFSGVRRTISWDRISLGSTNIERTECLKSWLQSNITAGRRLLSCWQNLESSRHLLQHAKDHEGDNSGERAAEREQLF